MFKNFIWLKYFILPPSLFFIVLFPSLLGLYYEPNSFHRVETYFLWGLLVAPLFILSQRKIAFVVAILFLIMGAIEIFHLLIVKVPLTESTIFVVFETNVQQAAEYISLFFSWSSIAVILAYLVFSVWLFKKEKKIILKAPRKITIIVSCFLLILLIVRVSNGRITRSFPPLVEAVFSYYKEINLYKDTLSEYNRLEKEKLVNTSINKGKQEIYVIIIGESTGRNHMSLYGYPRKTTPRFDSLNESKELVVFKDVVSAFAHSIPAIRTTLTFSNTENNKKIYEVYSVIDLFRAANFHVVWLSNKVPIGIWDNLATIIAKTSNENVFVNLSGNSRKAMTYYSFDEKLFEPFDDQLQDQKQKKVIILHLLGTHSIYRKRYPKEFALFPAEKNEIQNTINEYDNAVFYNDYVVTTIINKLKEHSTESPETLMGLIYFSDHGDEVYDSGDYIGHNPNKLTRYHVEIPFLVWLSASYKKYNKEKYNQILENIDKSYMIDDLIHTFLDFTNIDSPLREDERSLFSNRLKKRNRVIQNIDYDLELKVLTKK